MTGLFRLRPLVWYPVVLHWFGRAPRYAEGAALLVSVEKIMVKAMVLGAILTGSIALVIGSQGTSAGPLAVEAIQVADFSFYWSWPIFAGGSGLAWGIILLLR
ncbi:MAG: hypothetical protein AAGH57_04630 [Pseudomonadota bacterium]